MKIQHAGNKLLLADG